MPKPAKATTTRPAATKAAMGGLFFAGADTGAEEA